MKQKLTHNLNLKVLAVLFSVMIWIIVVNIDDPVKSVQFNDVPVQVINESALTDENLCYEIKEGFERVDVTMSGRRSVIEDISKDNVTVVADLNERTENDTVKLKVSTNKYSGDIDSIKADNEFVELNIEELKKIQKVIQIETVGNPAEGYIEGDTDINLNRVRIEGPASIVDMVAYAKVQIDVEGATNNISASAPIVLYDTLGDRIDMSRLSMNIDTISVNQNILFTKTVPITCIPSGKPVDGYKANGKVELSPSMITIAGPRPVLDNITQIAIPSSAVNINDEDATYKTIVNINGYLPSGVTASDRNFGGNVSVSVQIEKEISKKYSVYLNKISMEGLDSNMTAEVTDNTLSASGNKVEIEVFGLPDELDGLSSSDFDLSVDFDKYKDEKKITAMKAGTYDLPLQIDMPSGLRTESNLRVRVKVSEK
ncbi:MAG: hypothetical protein J6U09_03070 [Lachnospiraceae bacterium]|nr:hypothetical protein [Lachnospiraceae bacterium]